VKDEIKQLIDELKNLSAKNEELRTKKDTLDSTITTLNEEVSMDTKHRIRRRNIYCVFFFKLVEIMEIQV
jgi:chromosome segregation ATPase